ncbi:MULTISPECIES: SDR family NAD(P)-dependent oxidoreductase [Hyphomonas]|mgnify:CR=1 FL=1|uniref:Dehydrogenase n=1 Tax=Hyphomonas adhaerens TaxID=81029 RepID=A0A3B9GW08_9PROT|nr:MULTISPECIES: glucose 1-dehydrogenase [Hyphomonas]MBB41919.1 dehydrogenase [Hyphomonas sp.]HAE26639.1 dehydrogenase [Hyphomonas adhaerens]|tara:strand:- start:567 stop:1364 length:798 start_codon:yes stop_codon:yes gene_type:complete
MTGRVEGKIACITGAANGIGRCVALTLAKEGATVIATDLQREAGVSLAAEIEAAGGNAMFIQHDVTAEADWDTVIATIRDVFGRLDALVNNAGIGLPSSPVTRVGLDDWKRLMAVNVDGPFLGVKHALPLMREHGGGSIINVSSIAGIKASANASAYCASKGAVRLFTKSVALECAAANDGIRVNSVHPGIVETAIWDTLIGTAPEESGSRPRGATLAAFTSNAVPLGRPGLPEEIAAGILWLASDESSYVTGTELVIDGARSIA